MESISTFSLECGAVLLVERIEAAASAALTWLVPVGSAGDPEDRLGESALLNEFTSRGAGGLTSREHSDALDRAGVQRSSHIGTHHLTLGATFVGSRTAEVLPLFGMIATDLTLDEDGLQPAQSLCIQSLESLKDDPQHLAMLRLKERHLPAPFNRHGYGDARHIAELTTAALRGAWKRRCVPHGSIIALAGAVDGPAVRDQLDRLLAAWRGESIDIVETQPPRRGIGHEDEPTAQVHIGIAWDAPREADENSMVERIAANVLSGGMSGRLFTEVREKRSLCYSVSASYSAGRDRGYVSLYAGTTPERAQETLNVCAQEVRRMREGVTEAEFKRAVVGLKSRVVMQGESTSARAAAIANDWFRLGRARTLAEVSADVAAVSFDRLNTYLSAREVGKLTAYSIGPKPLELK